MQCEATYEVYGPNDGCQEYATEPEALVRCTDPAAVLMQDIDPRIDAVALCWQCAGSVQEMTGLVEAGFVHSFVPVLNNAKAVPA